MLIRSIESGDRDYFIRSVQAFYHSPAVCHEIPVQNAERTFELLLHGSPYADCLIAEEDGRPVAYCLLAVVCLAGGADGGRDAAWQGCGQQNDCRGA